MKSVKDLLSNVKTTSYGLKFIPITREDWQILKPITYLVDWSDYDRHQVEIHFMNGEYAFLDANYQRPIDNEYDLKELYQMAKNGLI